MTDLRLFLKLDECCRQLDAKFVAKSLEELTQLWNIFLLNSYVEVFMRARLILSVIGI